MSRFVPLEALVEAVAGAMNDAQSLMERAQIEGLRAYLDGDRPRTLELSLPSVRADARPGETDIYSVPLLALVPHGSMRIRQVDVQFDLELGELTDSSSADVPAGADGPRHRSTLTVDPTSSVDPAKRGTMARVTLVVEALERPEALSRLIDDLIRTQGYRPGPDPGTGGPERPPPAPP
ncbi:MAG: DUF2589 domain-containing protein, partial [Alphaproteobacteria bacterium]|nr:DUF2589 domain-containing protein [Alphaproteobacteria bacterium]